MVDRDNYLAGANRLKFKNGIARLRGAMTEDDFSDLMRFKVSSSSNVQVDLSKIARGANVDLQLFNFKNSRRQVLQDIGRSPISELSKRDLGRNLSLIAKSTNRGNSDESISTLLEPGDYYLRIFWREGRTRYQLDLSASPLLTNNPGSLPPASNPGSDLGSDAGGTSGDNSSPPVGDSSGTGTDSGGTGTDSGGTGTDGGGAGTGGDGTGTDGGGTGTDGGDNTPVLPTALNDLVTVNEDSTININVLANDDFGGDGPGAIAIALSSNPSNGNATVNLNGTPTDPTDDTIDYSPSPNYNGADSFTYTITDSTGDTATATVNITVTPVDEPPVSASWMRQLGSSGNDYAYAVATDSQNRVYIVGSTSGSLPGNSTDGGSDAFIAQYDSAGNRQWVKQLGTSNDDLFTDVAVDANGNIYAVGAGNVTPPALSPFSTGSGNAYLVKYNNSGQRLWLKNEDNGDITSAAGVAVDASGNVYMAGASVTINAGLPPSVSVKSFVSLYDSAGNAQSLTGDLANVTNSGGISSIAVDASGNIYVAGITDATVNLSSLIANPNPSAADLSDFLTGENAFVASYTSAGTQRWFTKLENTTQESYARRLALDASGNVYVAGETNGVMGSGSLPANSNAGGIDSFLARLNGTNGTVNWIAQFGTTGDDQGQGVAVDGSGNAWITGEVIRTGGSDTHAFYAQYNSNGTSLSLTEIGTTADDEAYGITVNSNGDVVLTGQTLGVLDDSNAGAYDVWVSQV